MEMIDWYWDNCFAALFLDTMMMNTCDAFMLARWMVFSWSGSNT